MVTQILVLNKYDRIRLENILCSKRFSTDGLSLGSLFIMIFKKFSKSGEYIEDKDGISFVVIFCIILNNSLASNKGFREHNSNNIHPSDQISTLFEYFTPWTNSGAIYSGEPANVIANFLPLFSVRLSPKSPILQTS